MFLLKSAVRMTHKHDGTCSVAWWITPLNAAPRPVWLPPALMRPGPKDCETCAIWTSFGDLDLWLARTFLIRRWTEHLPDIAVRGRKPAYPTAMLAMLAPPGSPECWERQVGDAARGVGALTLKGYDKARRPNFAAFRRFQVNSNHRCCHNSTACISRPSVIHS